MSADGMMKWNARVEQELTCAAVARDISARKAHFELALLHFEATTDEQRADDARDMLSAALLTPIAFAGDD